MARILRKECFHLAKNASSSGAKAEPKFPAGEIPWTEYTTRSGRKFYTTSTADRATHFLYEQTADGKLVKLGKDANPKKLEKQFIDMTK